MGGLLIIQSSKTLSCGALGLDVHSSSHYSFKAC